MKTIVEIIKTIASESSTNKKVELLKEQKDNEFFKKVLYLTYSPRIKFYMREIPSYNLGYNGAGYTFEEMVILLKPLYERKISGHNALVHIDNVLKNAKYSDETEYIKMIINKDLKMGISSSLINKAFGDLIEETPYMGCKPFSAKLINNMFKDGDSAFSEVKADGRYVNVIMSENGIEMVSRQGEPSSIKLESKLMQDFKKIAEKFPNNVLNGELVIPNINRLTSNGIIASVIDIRSKIEKGDMHGANKSGQKLFKEHNVQFNDIIDRIEMICWDIIPVEDYYKGISNTPRKIRLQTVINTLSSCDVTNIKLVEYKEVHNLTEAINHLNEMLARGEEGTVVKSYNGIWKDGKHPHQVKCKLEMELDLKIVGFNYGEIGTKNEKVISSVNVESSDGIIKASAQGIKEKMMQYITDNQNDLLGKILAVKCNGISQNKNGEKSLFYPTFVEIRTDKIEADSYQQCLDIENMTKCLS